MPSRCWHTKEGSTQEVLVPMCESVYVQPLLFAMDKRCTVCGETKPLAEFYFIRRTRGPGRYDSDCKKCHNAYSRAYRLANPEKCLEHVRRWRETHVERQRELSRRYVATHADEIRAANQTPKRRAQCCAKQQAYYRRNREKLVQETLPRKQRRRARLQGVGGNVTQAEWRERVAYFNGCCAYCGERMEPPTQDHMTPLSRGGAHLIENIVPACRECNSSKGTKNLLDYLIYERG